jgi:hypothetical protein
MLLPSCGDRTSGMCHICRHNVYISGPRLPLKNSRDRLKMAARGRKQKACLLQRNLGETLETHLAGKATKKRQNFEPSTPPAGTEISTSH